MDKNDLDDRARSSEILAWVALVVSVVSLVAAVLLKLFIDIISARFALRSVRCLCRSSSIMSSKTPMASASRVCRQLTKPVVTGFAPISRSLATTASG